MQGLSLNTMVLNNSLFNYLLALLFLLIVYGVIKLFDRFILARMNLLIKKFSTSFAILLRKIIKKRAYPLLYILAIYLAVHQLSVVNRAARFINYILMILTVILTVLALLDLLVYSLKKYWQKRQQSYEQQKLLGATVFLIKTLVWIIAALFILDNLNIEITGLVTGLGIGGVAIAFAAQNILTDLFNYITIFFDKPFDIGDFIITGDYKGSIEHIGIKTTRIRSLSGEEIIISNTDLVNSRINNYKRMQKRRINFSFGLTYNTSLEKLKKIPQLVQEIITSLDKTEFDRAHFAEYASSSLLFQVVYYVTDSDYKLYMDIQEQINFALKEKFNQLGIEFAFPTQTIYLANQSEQILNQEVSTVENSRGEN
jgi:small-conductance mechanosensitive channel